MLFKEFKGNVEIGKSEHDMLKSCLGVDPLRALFHYVHIDSESSKVTATNGRILIQYTIPTPITVDGWYEPAKVGKKYLLLPVNSDIQPPDYSRVFPEKAACKMEAINLSGKSADVCKDSQQICEMILKTNSLINLDFLWRLKNLPDVNMYADEPDKPIMFTASGIVYVIMPMAKDAD